MLKHLVGKMDREGRNKKRKGEKECSEVLADSKPERGRTDIEKYEESMIECRCNKVKKL